MTIASTSTVGPVSVNVPWAYDLVSKPANTRDDSAFSFTGTILTFGTGAGQFNIKYSEQLSIGAGSSTTLNLSSLTDHFGNSLNFVRIKELYIENSALATASALAVGNAGVTPFAGIISPGTATISIRNGCSWHIGPCTDATGYVVSTGVNLLITNSDGANAATVNVFIAGCDA